LHSAIFSGLGLGTLAATAFQLGSAAGDTDDRVIYDSATGFLYFDRDGSGAHSAIHFATLATGLALSNADFVVV
jgi:Ca2+-binding RTX toxin-like protein